MKLSFKQKLTNFEPCSNKFELGRVWAALDLEPFIFTSKTGTRFFREKLMQYTTSIDRGTHWRRLLYTMFMGHLPAQ